MSSQAPGPGLCATPWLPPPGHLVPTVGFPLGLSLNKQGGCQLVKTKRQGAVSTRNFFGLSRFPVFLCFFSYPISLRLGVRGPPVPATNSGTGRFYQLQMAPGATVTPQVGQAAPAAAPPAIPAMPESRQSLPVAPSGPDPWTGPAPGRFSPAGSGIFSRHETCWGRAAASRFPFPGALCRHRITVRR